MSQELRPQPESFRTRIAQSIGNVLGGAQRYLDQARAIGGATLAFAGAGGAALTVSYEGTAYGQEAQPNVPAQTDTPAATSEATPAPTGSASTAKRKSKFIDITKPVNIYDPNYSSALANMQNDKYRATPWAGDDYGLDVFFNCPIQTRSDLALAWRYSAKRRSIDMNFTTTVPMYCDLMGHYEHKFFAELKGPDSTKFRKVGLPSLYRDGLPEVLVNYGLDYDQYQQKTAQLASLPDLCGAGAGTKLRISYRNSFIANRRQEFAHNQATGKSTDIRSSGRTFHLPPRSICK